MITFTKSVFDELPYTLDCSDRLPEAQTISSIDSVAVSPSGLTISNTAVLSGNKGFGFKAAGGANKVRYEVKVHMTLSGGFKFEAKVFMKVDNDS